MSHSAPRLRPRPPCSRLLVLILFILAATVPDAGALVTRQAFELDGKVRHPQSFRQSPRLIGAGDSGPAADAAADFRARRGGQWTIRFDERTGRPALISGSGIPLLPGRGNSLTAGMLGLPSSFDLADAEPLARAFISAERDLLRPDAGELRLNPNRSGSLDGGRIHYFDYDWYVDDIPVEGARVFLRVNSGNIVQFGTDGVGRGRIPTVALLDADAAIDRMFTHAGGMTAEDLVVDPGHLLILPLSDASGAAIRGGGVSYRLVWRVAFRRGATTPTWTADIDARSGEVLSFYDANLYARVTGGINPRTVTDSEEERPFAQTNLTQDGAILDSGDDARYNYSGGRSFTALDGPYFTTSCMDCESPEHALALPQGGRGDLRLGTGGVDQIGNGVSTRAERNAFFHLNLMRRLAMKWLNLAWFSNTVTVNVNIQDTCNAYWDGSSVNFFRSGGGCNNTGEIADVMYHEWGHGLDQFTNIGDGSTGEATGDVTAMHLTHDAMVGPGFDQAGFPVRDLDSTRVGYQARTDNLDTYCVDCSVQMLNCSDGPLGHEVHCEGEIYGQAHWDLAQLMIAKHGFNTGWQDLERIYFTSLPQADTLVPNLSGSVFDAYIAADDDNGNTADGTPNCAEIYAAFNAHGIASSSGAGCVSSPGCTRPAEPAVTPGAGDDRVILDWTSSAGATNYTILRSDFAATGAFLPIGTTAGTHFEDTTAHPGITYHYVVEAENGSGCRSTINTSVAATVAAAAHLDIAGVSLDDVPAGNRSGFAEPVEEVDLTVTLVNRSPADTAAAATATLSSSTPGVTVTTSDASYGAIAPDAAAASTTAYRADLAGPLACGDEVDFSLSIDDGTGSPAEQAIFPLLIGKRSILFSDDFETDMGWTVVAGSPAAIAGAWQRGDPFGTAWQPEQGAPSAAGVQCFFTGQNISAGAGDIDGGETILVSPVIDLSGVSAARLSYQRWWGDSATFDTADFFAVEVRADSGSPWVSVDSATATERAVGWQPFEIRLDGLIALTSEFQMRVRAADMPFETTVEAAIDEVAIEEITCDLTPPCFVEPSFAGLGAAQQGASCGEVDLLWNAASSNCANAAITYNIYRSTQAGFTPGPANRIATELSGLSFHDALLSPGVTYYYVARAFDSRSGEETNLGEMAVIAPASPDTVAPVFDGPTAALSGTNCGETIVTWPQAAETCSGPVRYDVYRSPTQGFTPGPSNLIASTLSVGYIDTAQIPGATNYYRVAAVDSEGNVATPAPEVSSVAVILPLDLYLEDFEASGGGWGTTAPNDASTGLWEWGDPEGTGAQPEDDATPAPGINAWITGLAAAGGLGGNDIDGGTTTLISPFIDLTGFPGTTLELALSFSNDAGANPNDDPLLIEVNDNAGSGWTTVLDTLVSIPPWTTQQFSLGGLAATSQFQIRVTASDLGVGGSLVEAGIDDARVFLADAGCGVCGTPVTTVGTVLVSLVGDDIVLDWSADPVAATSYAVHLLSGAGLTESVRAGTTFTRSFVHAGAALAGAGDLYIYRVTAVDACGQESALE